jgi:hypothetical protein
MPVPIEPYVHALAETHAVLAGGMHVLDANGVRHDLENGGYRAFSKYLTRTTFPCVRGIER